jgi:hypothetical protein
MGNTGKRQRSIDTRIFQDDSFDIGIDEWLQTIGTTNANNSNAVSLPDNAKCFRKYDDLQFIIPISNIFIKANGTVDNVMTYAYNKVNLPSYSGRTVI